MNKTWWNFGNGRRINLAHLTDIYYNSRRPAIFIHLTNEKAGETLVYEEGAEGYAQALDLLDYIDKELCINNGR